MARRASWQEYQKDIAADKYYYARSCIRQNFFPGSERAFLDILRNDLGIDIYDEVVLDVNPMMVDTQIPREFV